jgi:hypothetical protein
MVNTPTELAELRSHWALDVVVRRIDRPFAELPDGGIDSIGALSFTGPFVDGLDGFSGMVHAPAIVHLRKLALPALVDVQFVEWSRDGSELRIVPVSPYFALWSDHRRDRYFDLVHAAADRIARVAAFAPIAA